MNNLPVLYKALKCRQTGLIHVATGLRDLSGIGFVVAYNLKTSVERLIRWEEFWDKFELVYPENSQG